MADEANQIPPLPVAGEIVIDQQALQVQLQMWRGILAFGGTKDPSAVWSAMIRGDSSEFVYYRELEEKDDDVANGLRALRLGVLERDITLHAGDDSAKAEEVRAFIQSQFDGIPNFYAVLDALLDAPGYGFTVQEMIYDVSGGQASLLDIHDCPQELFLFGNRFEPQTGPLQFLDSPYAAEGREVPETKFLIYSYDMRARNRKGRPLIRSVFWLSWFKRNLLRFWLKYAERGPGTAVVRYADGADQATRQQAVQLAEALINQVACAVPMNFQYEKDLLEVARSQDPDVYDKLFQRLQYGIARRTQGQTLTSFGNEGGTGSKAQGGVHQDTLEQITRGIAKGAASVIQRQLVRPLVLWNFGPDAPMPKWGFDLEEEEDLAKRITIDSGVQRMGLPISKQYVMERYGMPAIEDGDEALVPNVSAPQVNETIDDRATFAETKPTPASVKKEMGEFDRIFDDLAKQSRADFKARAKEIADAVQP